MDKQELINLLIKQRRLWRDRTYGWRISWRFKREAQRKCNFLNELIEALKDPMT